MKRIFILLLVVILLAGCNFKPNSTGQNESSLGSSGVPSDRLPPENQSLMGARRPVGSSGNVWYIPNETVENTDIYDIYAYGDDLLIRSEGYTYNDDGDDVIHYIELKLISLENGTLTADKKIPYSGDATVQVFENTVCIADPETGTVTLLDEKLNRTEKYGFDCRYGETWYVGGNTGKLFCFDWEGEVYSVDLATKKITSIISPAWGLSISGYSSEYVFFSYVDSKTQLYVDCFLDLETGEIKPAPFKTNGYGEVWKNKDTWIYTDFSDIYCYIIHTPEHEKVMIPDEENQMLSFAPMDKLVTMDELSRKLTLYDLDGNFVSSCVLPPDGICYLTNTLIWSQKYNGYFLLDMMYDNGKLLFWETDKKSDGNALPLSERQESGSSGGVSVDSALYERAEELSKKFGVNIRIADRCQLEYGAYSANEEYNAYAIAAALKTLEDAMSVYPEGFFRQLKNGRRDRIYIELVGDLFATDGYIDTIAFTQENFDYYLIVMNTAYVNSWDFYHEVSHIIDKKLNWDSMFRPEALYSEEAWLGLQPKGFDYAYSYTYMPESVSKYFDSGYFTMTYSMTYPTEDRANILASAMSNEPIFPNGSPVRKKLDFYCRCIRDCFDTTGWPEVLPWEVPLK